MAEPLLIFRGEVHCKCSAGVPGLTLSGYTSAHPETRTTLAFSAAAPAEFPATLQDALIEQLPEGNWRIKSATREWRLANVPVHLHRAAAEEFYRALPPRPVPWLKRSFWRLVLLLARHRGGFRLLRALRG
jgi:hypothetical protein